ncbi:hypothetical protein YC2023_037812 [Brassica napus]
MERLGARGVGGLMIVGGGWWRNRPSVSLKWDFTDQRRKHGFSETEENRERELPKKGESDRRDREVNRKAELAGKGIGVSVIGHGSVWCTATPPDLIRSGQVCGDKNTENRTERERGSGERLGSWKRTDRVPIPPSESDGARAA